MSGFGAECMFSSIVQDSGLKEVTNSFNNDRYALVKCFLIDEAGKQWVRAVEQGYSKGMRQFTQAEEILDLLDRLGIDVIVETCDRGVVRRFGFDVTTNPSAVRNKAGKQWKHRSYWKEAGLDGIATVLLRVGDGGYSTLAAYTQDGLIDQLFNAVELMASRSTWGEVFVLDARE